VGKIRLKKQKSSFDKKLLVLTLSLTFLGLVAVADASAPIAERIFGDKFYFAKQQLVWGIFGVFLMILVSQINYRFWEKATLPLFALSIILLILVLIPGLGVKALGARRWLGIGPISFQPSEFVKLTLIFYLAKVAAKEKKFLSYLIPVTLISLLIMLQPDLGTTIVLGLIALSQIYISQVNIIYLLITALAGGIASFLLIVTSPYRKERLITFLRETQDPLGSGYHIRQILLALGSGGLLGVGIGASRQKFLFLPEAATDSIFAIIAEEVGFIGSTILIVLFGLFIYLGTLIIKNAPDTFSRVLAAGIVAWIGGQALLNMATMTAIVPITGIPLPFFSYGGSSLTMVLLATGVLLNISRYVSKER